MESGKRVARRALAVALARAHDDVVTAGLTLSELVLLAVERGLPASPDLLVEPALDETREAA